MFITNFHSNFDAVLQQSISDGSNCPVSVANPSSSAWVPLSHTWTFIANGWAGVLNLTNANSAYGAWDNQQIGHTLNGIALNGVETLRKAVCFERYGGTFIQFWRQGPNQQYDGIVSFNGPWPSIHGSFIDPSGPANSYTFDASMPLWLLGGNPVFPSVQPWNWQCAKWGILANSFTGYLSTVWGTNTLSIDTSTYPSSSRLSIFVLGTSPQFTIDYWYNHYGAMMHFVVPAFTVSNINVPQREFWAVASDDGFHGHYVESGATYHFDAVELNSC